jgi:TolB protein
VYTAQQGEVAQLHIVDLARRTSVPITTGAAPHVEPSVSRDGRVLVGVRVKNERSEVWRIDLDSGQGEARLGNGVIDRLPALTPDGTTALFVSIVDGRYVPHSVPVQGGPIRPLGGRDQLCSSVSPDGSTALCSELRPSGDLVPLLVPLAGGEPRPIEGLPRTTKLARWSAEPGSISYLVPGEDGDELWNLPLDGSPARPVARFENQEIGDFAWSPDGTRLAVVPYVESGDVVLLRRGV